MKSEKLNEFRETLLAMRQRVGDEVNHVVEAIHEEVNVDEDISSAPVHLADIAEEGVEADVAVLHATRSILDEINQALNRIHDGSFGTCVSCGAAIPELRLKALPYTPLCMRCAGSGVEADELPRR
jgi:RNA polymerase-binding protein DksA